MGRLFIFTKTNQQIHLKLIVLSFLFVSACATQTGWTPTVDPYGNQHTHRLNQDYSECRQLAHQASDGVVRQAASGVLVGGLIGAATGAAFGAISGHPGRGAAYGGIGGGIGGGVRQGFQVEGGYKRAYGNCMRHRGHNVVN